MLWSLKIQALSCVAKDATAISDNLNGTPRPPLPPNQGWEMARFSLRATSSLILGGVGEEKV